MPPAKIFFTGATGYIGGAVLTTLLKYPNKYQITALVRSKDQVETLKKLGVDTVIGDLNNLDLLTRCSKAADAVVNTADNDHLPSAQAIVRGLKAKEDKRAVLLHTSGTGVLTNGGAIKIPFDDLDMARINAIPEKSPHKWVDSWIFENSQDIRAAIICPSTINGIGNGPFRKLSQQVPGLIKSAVIRKQAGWVGPRKDVVWGDVNIHDLAELYRLVLDGLLANTIEHGKEGGFYFCSTSEHQWVEVSEAIAKILHKLGLVDTLELTEFNKEYVDKYFYGDYGKSIWKSDSRAVSNRSLKIGWNPTHPGVFETLEQEIMYILENEQIKK